MEKYIQKIFKFKIFLLYLLYNLKNKKIMGHRLIFSFLFGILLGIICGSLKILPNNVLFWVINIPIIIIGNYLFAKYCDTENNEEDGESIDSKEG